MGGRAGSGSRRLPGIEVPGGHSFLGAKHGNRVWAALLARQVVLQHGRVKHPRTTHVGDGNLEPGRGFCRGEGHVSLLTVVTLWHTAPDNILSGGFSMFPCRQGPNFGENRHFPEPLPGTFPSRCFYIWALRRQYPSTPRKKLSFRCGRWYICPANRCPCGCPPASHS